MKKLSITFIILLQAITAMAEIVEFEGLKYNLNVDEKTASVGNNTSYSGILVIPEKFEYEGVEYTVTAIGQSAFYKNYNLLSVTIPKTVKTIGDYAFESCSSLSSAKIGDGVESIGNNAFYYCSLVSITIGKNVSHIGSLAFNQCFNLTQVYISDLAAWCRINIDDMTANPLYYSHHLYLNKKEVKELIIPDGVTELKKYAFAGASNITSLTINDGVTSIGNNAFYGCTSLTTVTFCSSLESIGNQAFYDCSSIGALSLPDGITTIGEYAFRGCENLEEMKLSDNLQIIKKGAFAYCNGLTNITIPSKMEFIYGDAFSRNPQYPLSVIMKGEYPPIAYPSSFPDGTKLIVPDESLELYESVSPWSNYDLITFSGSGPEKCAEPEIIYRDRKIVFSCQTPDVDFHYSVTSEDVAEKKKGNEIPISANYQVTVYATKAGYEKSDVVSKSIEIETIPTADLNNDGEVNAVDAVKIVNIIMGKEVYPKED